MFGNEFGSLRLWSAVGLMISLMGTGGCTFSQTKDQNAELWQENQELHDNLRSTREALDAAMANEAKLQDANAQLGAQLAAAQTAPPAPLPPAPPAGGASGFSNIPGVGVEVGANQVTVRVPGDVLFSSGQAMLRTKAKATLSQVARVLNGEYAGMPVRIEGHTDSDPIRKSKWSGNQELSVQRAISVERFLAERGVSDNRMSTLGMADSKPRASNKTSAGKSKNRRVEIIVVTRG
ncbi:MAG: OmpA family protein [Phycisphaerae bacterium]|nr:OmpA family protein [Phycisphaerae bacterium]